MGMLLFTLLLNIEEISSDQPVVASWYGEELQGRPMANGDPFDPEALTAAHPDWPMGTWVHLTNPATGITCLVVITDRGPFVPGRDIDISRAAAERLGIIQDGVVPLQATSIPPLR